MQCGSRRCVQREALFTIISVVVLFSRPAETAISSFTVILDEEYGYCTTTLEEECECDESFRFLSVLRRWTHSLGNPLHFSHIQNLKSNDMDAFLRLDVASTRRTWWKKESIS